ncbi:MAG TPA: polysaccharide deacetylase family protein [Solirubrobacterales bacterium]|nr:polysaccharide deacetylase family protein [Solirubrobacterales bacterium]
MNRTAANLKQSVVARIQAQRARRSSASVGIALCYHRIDDPPGDPEQELVPALGSDRFAEQVEMLASRYEPVLASDLRDAAASRQPGQRIPVAITFDDDLPTHTRKAMPVLLRAGVPATFFVSGASLEAPFAFWWERLQRAWDRGLVDESWLRGVGLGSLAADPSIHAVAAAIEGLDPGERAHVAAELANLAGADGSDCGMRTADVRELVAAGFEIGFHTLRHDRLPDLDDDALAGALSDGREDLERAVGGPLRSVSYPHGKADGRTARAARAAGFDSGFTAGGRSVGEIDDPHLIDRGYPASGDVRGFDRHLAGKLWQVVGEASG